MLICVERIRPSDLVANYLTWLCTSEIVGICYVHIYLWHMWRIYWDITAGTKNQSWSYIWEEICWPYKAPFWCHIFCIFEHLFWQLRGVLCQNFQHFLKIYECQIVYIPLFWPVLHRGPVQLPIHFTLPQKIVAFQNIICSLFLPFFVFLVIW